jgi:DNA-binding NarL/FixJ family response regulator
MMSPAQEAIRVVIVDDHPMVREGLARVLDRSAGVCVVAEADCGCRALELLGSIGADVILLDFRLPDMDGLEVLSRLAAAGCPARVVMLTCFSGEHFIRAAVEGGACGFLTKSSADRAMILDAVRSAHRGQSYVSPDALTNFTSIVRTDSSHCPDHMTERELEVWALLAEGKTNGEIAQELFVSERTVKFHVGNVYRKTQVHTRAEATALAFRCGLMDVRGQMGSRD